ncbi:MAG: hypothetical protein ACYTGX_19345 [Planctomycetota bacterium]
MSLAAGFFAALAGGVAGSSALMDSEKVRPGVWRTMAALVAVAAGVSLAIILLAAGPAGAPYGSSQGLRGGLVGAAIVAAGVALAWPGRAARLSLAGGAIAAGAAFVVPLLSLGGGAAIAGSEGAADPVSQSVLLRGAAELTAMAVLGAALASMILGHWYLVGDGMPLGPFRRLAAAYGIAVVLRIITLVIGLVMLPGLGEMLGSAEAFLRGGGVGLTAVLAFGMILPPILALGARSVLRIPNTQAATGLLYVACIAAIICDLSARGAGL